MGRPFMHGRNDQFIGSSKASQVFVWLSLCLNFVLSACNSENQFAASGSKDLAQVYNLNLIEVEAGDVVEVNGDNFSSKFSLILNEAPIELTVVSSNKATFVMPALKESEFQNAEFIDGSKKIGTFTLVDKNRQAKGVANVLANTLCSDVILTKEDGSLLRGERNCVAEAKICDQDGEKDCLSNDSFPALDKTLIAAAVVEGKTLGNIAGTLPAKPLDCAEDGDVDCVTVAAFPAADLSLFLASNVKTGVSLAGIPGTLIPIGYPCEADGESNCLTENGFVAIDKVNSVQVNLSRISSQFLLLGLNGTLPNCAADGETSCIANAPNFAAAIVAGAAAKISSGLTLAGINGSAPVKPSNCATDGAIACVANSDFPAAEKDNLTNNVAKIRSGFSVAGVSGTLASCSSDGQDSCVALGPTYAMALTAGAQAKILTGQTLAGIGGTAAVRPADCDADAETSCVATALFPAVDTSTAAPKIVLNQIVGGVTGSAGGVKPSDCAIDGELWCHTTALFPAMELLGADTKIAAGDSLGGVIGTAGVRPSDCSASGATSCVAITDFPALDKIALSAEAGKIRTGLNLAGVAGSLDDCASDGGTDCVTVAAFPALDKVGKSSVILNTATLGGALGSALPKPADCAADGATTCVAVTDYPAVNKTLLTGNADKIRSSLTIANVLGTLDDCDTDGETSCVAVADFPAANTTGAEAKILTGQTLAGVGGSALARPSDCIAGEDISCVSTTDYPSLNKTNLTNNAAKVRTSLTVSAVPGTLGDCSTDNQNTCVTSVANPAVVLSNVTTGVVKAGSVIAGVTGVYPNATYPLPVIDGITDLLSATFASSLKSANPFAWFDRNGTRFTGNGSANFLASNIKNLMGIFGTTGNYQGGALNPPVVELVSNTANTSPIVNIKRPCCLAENTLIVRRQGAPVIWTPTNGTNYAGGVLPDDQLVYGKIPQTRVTDSGLVSAPIYHYAFYSVDANNNYSALPARLSTRGQTLNTYSSLSLAGDRWYTAKSSLTADGYPFVQSDNSVILTNAFSNQGTVMFKPERLVPNVDIDFDYNTLSDGGDGFSFIFGKNFMGEYVSPPNTINGGAKGMFMPGTGYGISFTTYLTNTISVWNLAGANSLHSVNEPLEHSLGNWVPVKIRISANNVKVYMNGSVTPALDYTHSENWVMTYPFIGFGAGTGGATAAFIVRNIRVSNF